jgi:transcriptional regulator with XRE-family HTH domain
MTDLSANAGAQLRAARERMGLSLREVARRAGTSHATLSAYERGLKSPSLQTFYRIVHACDLALDLQFRPRVRYAQSSAREPRMTRGEELEAVLRLAAQFPSRPARQIKGPVMADLLKGRGV